MATELQQMIDVVAKDKGIDAALVISAIEDAYLAAARKIFKRALTLPPPPPEMPGDPLTFNMAVTFTQ